MSLSRKRAIRRLDAMRRSGPPHVVVIVGGLPGFENRESIRIRNRRGNFVVTGGVPDLPRPVEVRAASADVAPPAGSQAEFLF
jgi:hypothetical protein